MYYNPYQTDVWESLIRPQRILAIFAIFFHSRQQKNVSRDSEDTQVDPTGLLKWTSKFLSLFWLFAISTLYVIHFSPFNHVKTLWWSLWNSTKWTFSVFCSTSVLFGIKWINKNSVSFENLLGICDPPPHWTKFK